MFESYQSVSKWALRAIICLFLTMATFLSVIPARSQDKTPKKPTEEDEIVRVNSNLVNVDVIIKDKKGKVVRDLKAEDFIVTENGVKQNVEFFDATLVAGTSTETSTATPATTPTTTAPGVAPTTLPRNLVALVLDGQTTEATNLKPVREGIINYVKDRISNDDSIALFAIAGGLQLLQPFTQDKDKIISAVEKNTNIAAQSKTAEKREMNATIDKLRDQLAGAPGGEITTQAAGSAAAQAMITRRVLEQFIQLRSTLSVQQTRPILASLAAICEGLRPMRGKKTLVMFSQGFVAPEVLDWQVQSTIDIANRANVAIYIIDSTGLKGGVPQTSAIAPPSALAGISAAVDQESRIRAGAGESVFDISRQEGMNRQQDLLYRISEDTGGHFIKNTNDFADGLNRIDDEVRSRYTLAYRSTDQNFDGRFRKIKIEVKRPGVTVVSRAGYYAIPPTQVVPFSPEERKLMASFTTLEAHSTLPLSVALNSFRAQQGSYIVPVVFDLPPGSVTFDEKAGKRRLQLDVLGLVRPEGEDKILSRLGGNFNVELSPQQYESILNDKIFYRQDVELEPGSYTIDLMVRDRLSGKAAARRERLELPVAGSEFSSTKPILSRHATPWTPPLSKSADVFGVGNVLIRPSPSHQFRATDNLIILFRLYNAATAPATGKPLINVTVRLMRDGKLATKLQEFELSEFDSDPVPHVTFAKYVKLTGLTPGKYNAIIESRDMIQLKVSKQETSFEIVP
jgi:VWFA-related protein